MSPQLTLHTRRPSPEAEAGKRMLLVNRGEAFPPGHPTTRLCLDLLREALAAGPVARFLDLGCGSGILGLAAAALGVPLVVGADISPAAARATRENARENGLAGAILPVLGPSECLKAPFQLVAANLPWEVQMDRVAELTRLAAPGGRLLLSGFHDCQEQALLERYRGLGWSPTRRLAHEFYHPELPPDLSFTWVAWLLA